MEKVLGIGLGLPGNIDEKMEFPFILNVLRIGMTYILRTY